MTHAIVWDLDRTLGDFDQLHVIQDTRNEIGVSLRPGIRECLLRLSERSFRHVLLTLASKEYAEVILRAAGLRELFVEVSGRGDRDKGDAVGVGERLGIPLERLPDRLLFVGDHPLFDPPRDCRVVFHLELMALQRPAADLELLVGTLLDRGDGSFRRGFDQLVKRPWWRFWATREQPVLRNLPGLGRVLLLERQGGCPVVAFDGPPPKPATATEIRFVPEEYLDPAE